MSGRRSLLTGASLAGLAAALPALAAGDGDAKLLAECDAFLKIDRELKDWVHPPEFDEAADDANSDAVSAVVDRWYVHLELITDLRPTTPRGVQAKIRAACAAMESTIGTAGMEREEMLGLAALQDAMEALGGVV